MEKYKNLMSQSSHNKNESTRYKSRHGSHRRDRVRLTSHGQRNEERRPEPFRGRLNIAAPPDAFVENWLLHIVDPEALLLTVTEETQKDLVTRRPIDLEKNISSHQYIAPIARIPPENNSYRNNERLRDVSPDSSFLEPAFPVAEKGSEKHTKDDFLSAVCYGKHKVRPKRRRETQLSISSTSDSTSSISYHPKETFQRRKRHKTREDRYEVKLQDTKAHNNSTSRRTYKREKRGDSQRAARKACEALMKNFSSKKLGNDRLTIKPAHGPGLFKNGRASSPTRLRALPDIAFSEMDFLRRSTQYVNDQDEKRRSKSRKKDHDKKEREQEEIASYFRPTKESSYEEHVNFISRRSGESRLKKKGSTSPFDNRFRHSVSNSHSTDLFRPYLGFGSRGRTPIKDRRQDVSGFVPDIPNSSTEAGVGRPSRSTSYCTWSESIRSLPNKRNLAQTHDQDGIVKSPTPELVRTRLLETGIFDGTGLRRTLSREQRKEATRTQERFQFLDNTHRPPQSFESLVSTKAEVFQQEKPASQNKKLPGLQADNENIEEQVSITTPSFRIKAQRPFHNMQRSSKIPVPITRIKYLDSLSGWKGEMLHNIQEPQGSVILPTNQRPASRLELAQNLYVKVPTNVGSESKPQARNTSSITMASTTVPDPGNHEEHLPQTSKTPSHISTDQEPQIPLGQPLSQLSHVNHHDRGSTCENVESNPLADDSSVTKPNPARLIQNSVDHNDPKQDKIHNTIDNIVMKDVQGHSVDQNVNNPSLSKSNSGETGTEGFRPAHFHRLPTRGLCHHTVQQSLHRPTLRTPQMLVEPLYRRQMEMQTPQILGGVQNEYVYDSSHDELQYGDDMPNATQDNPFKPETFDGEYLDDGTEVYRQDEIYTADEPGQPPRNDLCDALHESRMDDETFRAFEDENEYYLTSEGWHTDHFDSYGDEALQRGGGMNDADNQIQGQATSYIEEVTPFSGFWRPFRH